MSDSRLNEIFYPDAIAIVGASKDTTKRGFRAIERLIADGYRGRIYPINPKEPTILGLPCFTTLDAVPGPIDLALICTPARTVPGLVRQAGLRGIKGAIVLAGGFAEAGEEGAALQADLKAAARETGVAVIGPNTSGFFNTHRSCNIAGFADLRSGSIGLISQSGNMALALVTEAQQNPHLGFSTYVGVGNQADLQFEDYLAYCGQDQNTTVVIAYIEGLANGRRFLDVLRQVSLKKPVVVFKSGRTSAGHSAAKSHTGALAGDYAVSEDVLRQAGAVLVRESDAILPVAETLSLLPPMSSRRVAVLADGGGHATIAADLLSDHGLVLADLTEDTKLQLVAHLPPAASLANPIDVAGGTDADPSVFAACAQLLLSDPGVDGLLIVGLFGGYGVRFSDTLTDIEVETSARIAALQKETGKPVLVHSLYCNLHGNDRPAPLRRLRADGVVAFGSLEIAVCCLGALATYGDVKGDALISAPDHVPESLKRDPVFDATVAQCRHEDRTVVLEHEARAALAAFGVEMMPIVLARSADEARDAFNDLGAGPVAMKVVSRDIIHKSEAGGIRLNVTGSDAAAEAFAAISESAERHAPGADLAGILVTPMARRGGVEVIIGVVRDPQYGPVMMFGLGGILVEILRDVVFRALPLSKAQAERMLDSLKATAVLAGVRGAKPVDRTALIGLMTSVSDLCCTHPEIEELDLNPVLAHPDGLDVLDARILLGSPQT